MYISSNKKTYAKDTPLSPSLNYITLQHRLRTKSERNIHLPKRNLNSILKGQINDENQPQRGQSPSRSVPAEKNALSKPKIEPVKLDDSTAELVAALRKPQASSIAAAASRTTSRAKSNLTAAIAAASPDNALAAANMYRTVTSPPPTTTTTAAAYLEREVIRSPFEQLCGKRQIASPMRPQKPPVPVSPAADATLTPSSTTVTPAGTPSQQWQEHVQEQEGPAVDCEDVSVSMDVSTDELELDCDADMDMDIEPDSIGSSGGSSGSSGSTGGNDRKRKHGRGNRSRMMARRGTLSPASVRAMLEEACAAESEGVSTSLLLGTDNTSSSSGANGDGIFATATTTDKEVGDEDMCVSYSKSTQQSSFVQRSPVEQASMNSCDGAPVADEDGLGCTSSEGAAVSYYEALMGVNRGESPQQDTEHTKKYARSGSPSSSAFLRATEAPPVCVTDELAVFHEVVSTANADLPVTAEVVADNSDEAFAYKEEERAERSEEYLPMDTTVELPSVDVEAESAIECLHAEPGSEALLLDTDSLVGVVVVQDQEQALEVEVAEVVQPEEVVEEEVGEAAAVLTEQNLHHREQQQQRSSIVDMSETDMDVIDDFGRELDNILCDVSSLGYSTPQELSPMTFQNEEQALDGDEGSASVDVAVADQEDGDDVDASGDALDAEFMRSPFRPSTAPSSPLGSEPEISQIDATPMSPPSPELTAMTSMPSVVSESEAFIVFEQCASPEHTVSSAAYSQCTATPSSVATVEAAEESTTMLVGETAGDQIITTDANDCADGEEMLPLVDEETHGASLSLPLVAAETFASPTKVLRSPFGLAATTISSAYSSPGEELYSYLDAHRPMHPPTPPSIPRRSAPSPKVGQFSPVMRSATSSKTSSPASITSSSNCSTCEVSMNRSLDESHLMFSEHDEDLETFEMLESMVEKEFEENSGDLAWDFGLPVTAAATMPCSTSDVITRAVESVTEAETTHIVSAAAAAANIAASSSAASSSSSMTPLKSPEPATLSSAERRRRGLSSIPRYHSSPAPTTLQHNEASPRRFTNASAAVSTPLPSSHARDAQPPSTLFLDGPHDSASLSSSSTCNCPHNCSSDSAPAAVDTTNSVSSAVLDESWPAELIDIAAVEAQARARCQERVLVAHWQCEWDIVSAQTANAAIKKFRDRS